MAERDRYPHRMRQLLGAVYYLREVIADAQADWLKGRQDRITNYVELIELIEQWRRDNNERVALVTFNYDTLLETAVHAIVGQRFTTDQDYVGDQPYSIFKLHGSIDWWRGIANPGWNGSRAPSEWAQFVLALDSWPEPIPGRLHVGDSHERTDEPVIPALSLPVLTKTDHDFACPAAHLETLRQALPDATRVLVIGWRGAEAHFYALWKESFKTTDRPPEQLLVVDKDEAVGEVVANLQASVHWLPSPVRYSAGFSELLQSEELSSFLNRG